MGEVLANEHGVWVTLRIANHIARIDPATNQLAAIIPVGILPRSLASDARGVWVGLCLAALAALADLPEPIGSRMFAVAQKVAAALYRSSIRCEAVSIGLADGVQAGQEVPHCHLHVRPRFAGDSRRPIQSATRAESDTGRRYQQHEALGSSIMLFARLRSDDRGSG